MQGYWKRELMRAAVAFFLLASLFIAGGAFMKWHGDRREADVVAEELTRQFIRDVVESSENRFGSPWDRIDARAIDATLKRRAMPRETLLTGLQRLLRDSNS